jgi:hypothetical protein
LGELELKPLVEQLRQGNGNEVFELEAAGVVHESIRVRFFTNTTHKTNGPWIPFPLP